MLAGRGGIERVNLRKGSLNPLKKRGIWREKAGQMWRRGCCKNLLNFLGACQMGKDGGAFNGC